MQFSLALLFAAAFLGWITLSLYKAESTYRNWATTIAVIQTAQVERRFDPSMAKGTNNAQQLYWTISVAYTYTVGDRSFTGTRYSNKTPLFAAGSETTPPASLVEIVSNLRPGSTVPIHYSPGQPQNSFVVIREGGWKIPLAATLALVLAGLASFGLSMRR